MEKKLRRKFILLSTTAVLIVLLIIGGFINLFTYLQISNRTDELISVISANDGMFPERNDHVDSDEGGDDDGYLPPKMSLETPFSTRFFTVKTDGEQQVLSVDTGKIFAASSAEALDYAKTVLEGGSTSGFLGNYRYAVEEKEYGFLVIFVDCERDLQLFYSSLQNSILICVAGLLAVFLLVFFFSKRAVAPLVESYEKQKQFITDASHELKTPLTIINANTDVLEMESGQSEWTRSTHNQVRRLSELVEMLVSLTRMDEEGSRLAFSDFSLSDAVAETAEPFARIAENQGKDIHLRVEKGISYYGNEASIRQLTELLLDNAIKYAKKDTTIDLSLKSAGRKIFIELSNEAENLSAGDYDILFDRFYRADSSRNSSTGGYGIGLSVVKAIAEKHKGRAGAHSPDGKRIFFTIQF